VLGRLEQWRDAANAIMGGKAEQSDDRSALMAGVKQIVGVAHFPTDKQLIADNYRRCDAFRSTRRATFLVKPGPASNMP